MGTNYGDPAMREKHLVEKEARPRGRPKGALGRRHEDAKAIVEKLGISPLEWLMKRMLDSRLPWDIRVRCGIASASFCHPRLSASHVSFTGQVDERVEIHQIMQLAARSPETAALMEKLALELAAIKRPETLELLPETQMLTDGTDEANTTADAEETDSDLDL